MFAAKETRKVHRWGSIITLLPVGVILVTGIVLQLKKDVQWVQPPTAKGVGKIPVISFDDILTAAKSVPEAGIESWKDVDRLDVRPSKGVVKVRCKNSWEIQVDTETKEVVQVRYRRSDWIESIHDGSFFSDWVKLWIFLPTAVILFALWLTGIYLFFMPYIARARKKRK